MSKPAVTNARTLRMAEQDRIVLAMLTKAAEMRDECPSNAVLAAACDFSAANQAPAVVSRLEAQGLIRVERGSRNRKVTIVATGQSTCEVISATRSYGHRRKQPTRVPARAALTPKDRLAEKVADSGSVEMAGWALRMSPARRDALWAEIVADLGPQAA